MLKMEETVFWILVMVSTVAAFLPSVSSAVQSNRSTFDTNMHIEEALFGMVSTDGVHISIDSGRTEGSPADPSSNHGSPITTGSTTPSDQHTVGSAVYITQFDQLPTVDGHNYSSSEDGFSVMIHDLYKKCCPPGQLLHWNLDAEEPQCAPIPSHMAFNKTVALSQLNASRLQHGPASCDTRHHFWIHDQDMMRLDADGRLNSTHPHWSFDGDLVCVDALWMGVRTDRMTISARVCDIGLPQPLVSKLELQARCTEEDVVCLRTCCPRGWKQVGEPDGLLFCEPSKLKEREWASRVYRDSIKLSNVRVVAGDPICPHEGASGNGFELWPDSNPNDWFQIEPDGSMRIPELLDPVPQEQYCLDLVQHDYRSANEIRAFVCYRDYPDEWKFGYFGFLYNLVAQMVTCSFLAATAVLYLCFPQLRNFHGACQMCYIASYLASNIVTFIMLLDFVRMNEVMCRLAGFILYYFFFCDRFWLTVICYDIYQAFNRVKAARSALSLRSRFFKYSIFAWGMPAMCTGLTLFMHLVPYDVIHPLSFQRPFSTSFCWIVESPKRLIYVDGPVTVLMAIDMVLLVMTIYSILKTDKQTQLVASHKRKLERFQLFGRIVLVMGAVWLVQCIAYQVDNYDNVYFWITLEIFTTLQGVVIFLLFTRRRVSRRIIAEGFSTTKLGVAWNHFKTKLNRLCSRSSLRSRSADKQLRRTCELNRQVPEEPQQALQAPSSDSSAPNFRSPHSQLTEVPDPNSDSLKCQIPVTTDSISLCLLSKESSAGPDFDGDRSYLTDFSDGLQRRPSVSSGNYCTKL